MKPPSHIRLIAIILIVVLVPLNCLWVTASLVYGRVSPTQISLYFNAIFSVLLLIAVNGIVRWVNQKYWLNQPILNRAELLTVYTCVSIGSGIAGVDRMMVLAPLIGHAHWFSTPENDWASLFHRYIPTWFTISDKLVLEDYYQGFSTL